MIVGQEHVVEQLMVSLLAKGHTHAGRRPGTAKTLAVRTFATVVGGDFARIQFTPDLVPSDIVGTRIYSAQREKFDISLGPVFVNFVLADEINRAPAKVQSAMLELMAEAGLDRRQDVPRAEALHRHRDAEPDRVRGRLPAPEAQRDRFLLKVDVPYPRGNEEFEILRRMSVSPPEPKRILNPELVIKLQDQASHVFVHNLVAEYIVRLVLATRTPAEFGMPDLASIIQIGASSRATLGLTAAARALALIHGRDYVLPTDVQAVAKDVMGHRIVLGFDAVADNISTTQVVERILAMVPAPTPVWNSPQPQSRTPQPAAPLPPAPQAPAPQVPQSPAQHAPDGQPPAAQPYVPQQPQPAPYPAPSQAAPASGLNFRRRAPVRRRRRPAPRTPWQPSTSAPPATPISGRWRRYC